MIGRTLSHFRIVDRVGEGGMGVVYRAQDEKLQRLVALKVLPPDRLADEEHRLRFLREARTAAAVTHPNIATVHEIDEADGVVFIAMEMVDGKPLRELIGGKPLPLREAIRLAVEIAEGLSAAHDAKVIHRDLKPENVIVTPGGRVKLLDFGLAKVFEEESASDRDEASRLATISREMTQAGRVMGTAAYMSPEQARGLPVDARSDVFSFGILLYEMVTGKAPFRGSTSIDTLTAILREQPVPPVQLNPEVPPELERIIGKCLEKEPGERYQDTRDLVVDLRHLKRDSDSQPMRKVEPSAPVLSKASKRIPAGWIGVAAALLVALAALGVFSLVHRERGAEQAASRFESMRMSRLASIEDLTSIALSPDGKFLAYVARRAGKYGLWVRQVATGSDVQIVPPQEAITSGPTFSPDGEYLYFLTRDPDNTIYNAVFQVPTLGGATRKILFDIDSAAAFSPDGKRISFVRGLPDKPHPACALMVADSDGGAQRRLVVKIEPDTFPIFVAPAWSPDGESIVAPVSRSGEVGSYSLSEFRVADGRETRIGDRRWGWILALTWLPDRSGLVLIGGEIGESAQQVWFVALPDGQARRITNDPNSYFGLSLSADARTLATVQVTSAGDLWSAPAGNPSLAERITSGEGTASIPYLNPTQLFRAGEIAVTPSGSIVFGTESGAPRRLWGMAADGTSRRLLTPEDMEAFHPLVARATGTIVFTGNRADRVTHVFRMDPDGGNLVQVTQGNRELSSAVSPDGQWLLYWRPTDTSFWKAPLAGGPATKIEISNPVTIPPRFTPDGKFVWFPSLQERGGRSRLGLEQIRAEGGAPLRWIDWPRKCDIDLPWKMAPTGDAMTCISELDGVYNLWNQPLAGGEPQPVTRFQRGHVLDFDWSADGQRLFLWRGDATTDVVLITNFK